MVYALVIRRNTQLAKARRSMFECQPNFRAIRYRARRPPSPHTPSNATSLSVGLMSTKGAPEWGSTGAPAWSNWSRMFKQKADFDHILVYDVSRWGRFQDVDESEQLRVCL
jgi:hypothetical protein